MLDVGGLKSGAVESAAGEVLRDGAEDAGLKPAATRPPSRCRVLRNWEHGYIIFLGSIVGPLP